MWDVCGGVECVGWWCVIVWVCEFGCSCCVVIEVGYVDWINCVFE